MLWVEIVEWETNQSLFPVGPKWGQVSTQCFPYRCHKHYRKHRNFHSIHHIPIIQNMGWSSGNTEAILNSFLALFHNIDVVTATATTMTTVKFDYNAVNAKLCPPLQLFGYLCGAAPPLVQQKRISSRFGAVLPCTALDFVKGMIWKLSAKPFSGPSQNLTFTFRFCSRTTLKTNWNFLHKLSAS